MAPGSGIPVRKKPTPDTGSRGQKGTGSRIQIRNTDCNTVELERKTEGWGDGGGGGGGWGVGGRAQIF
jgi:hypothetical protein